MKNFQHINATTLVGALKLLAAVRNSRVIAGGTDLLTQMKLGIIEPDQLVNLKTVPGLDSIKHLASPALILGH